MTRPCRDLNGGLPKLSLKSNLELTALEKEDPGLRVDNNNWVLFFLGAS